MPAQVGRAGQIQRQGALPAGAPIGLTVDGFVKGRGDPGAGVVDQHVDPGGSGESGRPDRIRSGRMGQVAGRLAPSFVKSADNPSGVDEARAGAKRHAPEGRGPMRGSKNTLPLAEDYGEGFNSRQTEWGGMIAEISMFPAGIDATPFFKGLPEDMCQSAHWGYVLKGRIRVRYKDREEVIAAGDAYYLEPGHTPRYEQDTEVVEFSPRREYQRTLEMVARNAAAMEESE
jgi:hypothetical protein